MTENYRRPTAEAIAALKAIDRQVGTMRSHELVEDVEDVGGVPAGVTATSYDPAFVVVPWGSFGLPSRAEVYGDEDGAS